MSAITITINGTTYSADENDLLVITSSGLYNSTKSSQIYTFVSTGGRFLGFNLSSGQSNPSIGYGILDTFTALEDLVLYSIEQQPAKTFDLSTLELSSGDHTITVKSTASGYGDSVASNIITYNSSSGGSVLRIYDAAALAEVFEIYSDGVKVAEAPIESAPDNAIKDSSGGYILANDGYLITTESSSNSSTQTESEIELINNY